MLSKLISSALRARLELVRRGSTIGVVRIVKAPVTESKVPTISPDEFPTPLSTRSVVSSSDSSKVSADVRVADLFRQYKQSSDKAMILSVLNSLSSMKIDGKVLTRFPGFIQLVNDLSSRMCRSEFSVAETVTVANLLSNLGIRASEHFPELAKGFSSQLVTVLPELSKPDLVRVLARTLGNMKLNLDSYTHWCLNKEMLRWASDSAISDEVFIREVLGPIQALAQNPLAVHFAQVLSSPVIEGRIMDLIKTKKLSNVQVLELIMKLKTSSYVQMYQLGISSLLSSYKDKLMSDLKDVSVLISALPSSSRDASVQSELASILLDHFRASEAMSAERIQLLLQSASELVGDISNPSELEILTLASPLVRDNATIVTKMMPQTLTNLFFMSAMAAVSSDQSMREPFLTICSQIESVIMGNLPALTGRELAKLSLAFASGIITHTNSFRALAATARRSAASFRPDDFVDAVYGLAYKGLINKGLLIDGNVGAVALAVPANALPRLAWAVAVSELSMAGVWDTLMSRIEKEILVKPEALENLSKADESMLYEVLMACRVNGYVNLSNNGLRRLTQFQMSWRQPTERSELDYVKLLQEAGLQVESNVQPKKLEASMTEIPILVPEYQLVLDATKNPVLEAGGLTSGSVKLRHSLWARMRYNVIGLADSQFADCSSDSERAKLLGSIVSQFAQEIQVSKQEVEQTKPSKDWMSRPKQTTNSPTDEWASRDESVRRRNVDKVAAWTSRQH